MKKVKGLSEWGAKGKRLMFVVVQVSDLSDVMLSGN